MRPQVSVVIPVYEEGEAILNCLNRVLREVRLPVAEIPTIWLDRQLGESRFDLGRFLPSYLHWFRFAYGRRLTLEQLLARTARKS